MNIEMDGMNNPSTEFGLLPPELWIDIFSFLPQHDLQQALQTCKAFSSISKDAWKAACCRRWPSYAAVAEGSNTKWKQTYDLLSVREREEQSVPDVNAILAFQPTIKSAQRAILVEWMFEVALECGFDSSPVFDSVRYVDYYLSMEVAKKSSFQLVGLACLRAAVFRFRGINPSLPLEESLMDPYLYSYFSAGACTGDQVEETTRKILDMIPESNKNLPNARMYLRSLWYQACFHNHIESQHIYIYSLAAFILELGTIHFPCAAYAPSLLASSALALSLMFYGRRAWPESLQTFICYTFDNLVDCMNDLAIAQQTLQASSFRSMWKKRFKKDFEERCDNQERLVQLAMKPSQALSTVLDEYLTSKSARDEHGNGGDYYYHSKHDNHHCSHVDGDDVTTATAIHIDGSTIMQHDTDNNNDSTIMNGGGDDSDDATAMSMVMDVLVYDNNINSNTDNARTDKQMGNNNNEYDSASGSSSSNDDDNSPRMNIEGRLYANLFLTDAITDDSTDDNTIDDDDNKQDDGDMMID